MAGMAMRNENLAESSRSWPVSMLVARVVPEREMPGNIAKTWERPTMRAYSQLG